MKNDFLSEIKEVKENFKVYAENALQKRWITLEEHTSIINKIENDKLTIGVIGQMKCGKSTFLNALIFQDEILPAATTPMTASLSVITYGKDKKLEAEFYTSKEWEELKHFSSLNIADYENDNNQKSKIKAAKEIVEKSRKISGEINQLLGTKKTDDFDNLIEYVGADGKYISLTKSVRIEYPDEKLKNVEIVDTPGFNDPVVSREERTKDFLKNADVVVMLLYAARAFDATDKDIIFNKVRSVGVGKILVGVNKYDINYMQGDTEQEIINNVKEQLLKASEEHVNSSISQLIKDQTPLLLSANMALMSQMELSKVINGDLSYYYNKALSDFEISTQKEMFQKSHMAKFEEAIREVIFKSKDEILIRKPINFIKQKADNNIDELVKNITEVSNNIKILEIPDEEREETLDNVKKGRKRIERKFESFKYDAESRIHSSSKALMRKLEDLLINTKKDCNRIIDDKSFFSLNNKLQKEIEFKLEDFRIEFSRILDRSNTDVNSELKSLSDELVSSIGNIVERFLEDFEHDNYQKRIGAKIEKTDVVTLELNDFVPPDETIMIITFLKDILNLATLGTLHQKLSHTKDIKNKLKEYFSRFDNSLAAIKGFEEGFKELLSDIEQDYITNFINPIEAELEKVISEKVDNEKKLIEAKENLESLKSNERILEKQVQEMKSLEPVL